MKLYRLLLPLLVMLIATPSIAQDAPEVTDEELRKYAVAMDSVDVMTKNLIAVITEMVENNEKISAARYNDLSKIADDSVKLAEANATAEEIAAIKEIITRKEEETAKINSTVQSLAKDYVGAATWNKVKKALRANPELKTKYDALLAELREESE